MLKGIDISNWQSGLNLANLNVDFAICKATEGLYFIDRLCDNFISQAENSGKLWGFYHFARNNSPENEASFFYDQTKNYTGNGIPVLDYEVDNEDNREWCERFIARYYDITHVYPLIYISAYRCAQYADSWIPSKCGLWIAGYPYCYSEWPAIEMPYNIAPWEFAAIWQFSNNLHLPDYNGALDGDYAYMDAAAWGKYAQGERSGNEPNRTLFAIALNTLKGVYGNGQQRKDNFAKLGYDYEQIQAVINKWYKLADEVLEGKWGNGWNRQIALGENYEPVQYIVNQRLGA